jgi:hypothetical protein
MTVTAAQIAALLKGQGELTVLAEMQFAYQQGGIGAVSPGQGVGFLSIPAGNVAKPASLPDSANNSITGDIELQIDFSMADYGPTTLTLQELVRKFGGVGNRAWTLDVIDGGTLRWRVSIDGSAFQNALATVTLPRRDSTPARASC